MELLDKIMSGLFGSDQAAASTPPSKFEPAPGLQKYPNADDVAYAKKYGFGYESGNEPFLKGEAARVLGGPTKLSAFVPRSGVGMSATDVTNPIDETSRSLDLTAPANAPIKNRMGDVYMQAALAANRLPVAALGFDPRQMVADVVTRNANYYGLTTIGRGRNDSYFNLQDAKPIQSTPLHESIHRGLGMLAQTPEGAALIKKLPDEELVVRYLMNKHAGDPEAPTSEFKNPQRQQALDVLGKGHWDNELEQLNALAAQQIARRKPGGPN